jgi:mitochondrial import receptor subunit TOM40
VPINAPPAASPAPSAFAPYLDAVTSIFHPVASPLVATNQRFHGWKESLGLGQPGTIEGLTREISRAFTLSINRNSPDIFLQMLMNRGPPGKLVL